MSLRTANAGKPLSAADIAHNFADLHPALTAAEAFARQAGFPEHYLVVRPEGENDPRIRKGIAAWPDLEAAFVRASEQSANRRVFL